MRFGLLLTLALLLARGAMAADELPAASASQRPIPDSIADPIKKALNPEGVEVTADGKRMLTLWVCSAIPTTAEDLPTYDTLAEGALIGALEIASESMTDFRDQDIPPGVYTLRLGLQPQDGNHMGVAPYPDFLCLVPAKEDTALAPVAHDDLMELSKKSAGTGHPTVLFLQPFFEKPTLKFPTITENDASHIVLNVATSGERAARPPVELPIAVVIVGVTDAE